jgi:CheY-like chemotaxis protein
VVETDVQTHRKKSILLVDDEASVRSLVRAMLDTGEYSFCEAENGSRAISCLKNHSYDLVITDIIMPGIDGSQVISVVRETHPATPVVAISGAAHPNTDSKALRADAVLAKPFTAAALISVARSLTDPSD